MTPPKDYIEIDFNEAIGDIYDTVRDIDKKLDQLTYWAAGVIIALAVCMLKLFF
jgi:hypothetical protein